MPFKYNLSLFLACAIMATPTVTAGSVRGIPHNEDFSVVNGPIVDDIVIGKSISFHPERSANFTSETMNDEFIHYLEMGGPDEEYHHYDLMEQMIDSYFPPDENFMFPGEETLKETKPSESEEDNENRILQEEYQYLYPLPCNDRVAELDCTEKSLSSLPIPTDGSPLVIECGTCVYVDISDGELLDLPNGLRIEGKLYFPPEASLTISTIYVMVLGILKIDYPEVGNEVKFQLYNEIVNGVAVDQYFIADPEQQDPKTTRCLGDGCKIGKKAIAVVGGQLDIQGFDAACPSWENLSDISTAETEAPTTSPTTATTMAPDPACSGNRFENGDFENSSIEPWMGWGGSIDGWFGEDDLNPGSTVIKVSPRVGWYQGPWQYLEPTCYSDTKQKWRLEMNLRLLDAETNEGIECDTKARDLHECPFLNYQATQPNGDNHWGSYYDHDMEWNKDGWTHFSVIFDSPEDWIDATAIRGIILGGPDTAILMVDNVKLERFYEVLPQIRIVGDDGSPSEAFPLGNCQGDCDRDSDCQDGLKCYQRVGFDPVPGCSGPWNYHKGRDFCYKTEGGSANGSSNGSSNGSNSNVIDNQIHLSQKVAECWTPGSEIMITSGNLDINGYQTATVESTNPATGTLKLTKRVDRVSTLVSDPDHAVEVALLSRRIIFEADDDEDDDLIGGHLIVLLTPDVVQHIEGVEIRNFGQQGNLGRYPVHFHLCNNSFGSTVKKNVVRQSNQRCYVMHGTNGVLIEDNVAFDTSGHCYMTEDGVEHSNRFIRNLGSRIKNAERLLGPREETDDKASIFWMTNMENDFEGNVASGAGTCYWVETHRSMNKRGGARYQRPDHKPMHSNLGSFKDNTAHSCGTGFAGYSPGWLPTERAVLENFRAFRIFSTGVFLHNNEKLTFKGGYFAQIGYVAFRVFSADDIIVDGTKFVGNIEDEAQLCRFKQHKAIIISPHRATTRHNDNAFEHFGTQLKNLNFTRWTPTENCDNALVDVSTTQIFHPGWDAYNLLENIVHDGSGPIIGSACRYEDEIASDTAIEVSGDSNTAYGGSGFLVGEVNTHLSNTDGGCREVGGCLYFCPNACLRTIKFYTSGARDVFGTVMKVSDGTNTATVKRWYKTFGQPNTEKAYYEYSNFGISLPAGSFTVWFEKEDEPGVKVYPKFVFPKFEREPKCSGYVTPDHITILKPPRDERCDDLINNGNFATDTAGWQEWSAHFYHSENAGRSGSGALVTTANHAHTTVTQWLDVSCIEDGEYLIHASYRMVDQTDNLATAQDVPILPNEHYGPRTSLQFRRWDQDEQDKKNIASSWMKDITPPTSSPTQSPTIETLDGVFPRIRIVGDDGSPSEAFPLGNCQGDCDRDSDCQDGLKCYQRVGFNPVPGCSGPWNYHKGRDFCHDPSLGPAPTSSPTSPPISPPAANALKTVGGKNGHVVERHSLGACQGDCDQDSDCEIGLICFQNNGVPVPGCVGNPNPTTEYCVNPNLPELSGFQYLSGQLTVTPDQVSRAAAVRLQFHGMDGLMILDNVSIRKAPWSMSEADRHVPTALAVMQTIVGTMQSDLESSLSLPMLSSDLDATFDTFFTQVNDYAQRSFPEGIEQLDLYDDNLANNLPSFEEYISTVLPALKQQYLQANAEAIEAAVQSVQDAWDATVKDAIDTAIASVVSELISGLTDDVAYLDATANQALKDALAMAAENAKITRTNCAAE